MTAVEWLEENVNSYGTLFKSDFIKAKEMEKQQGYSEKEVFKLLGNLIDNFNPPFDDLKDWFEQNKK